MKISDERLIQAGRQAMNLQAVDVTFKSRDSDGVPIEGTESKEVIVYNLETISREEVDKLIQTGMHMIDKRVVVMSPEEAASLFPHRCEKKKHIAAYWKSCSDQDDYAHCTCSSCGFKAKAAQAVDIGRAPDAYAGIRYKFCPNCGSVMHLKPCGEE